MLIADGDGGPKCCWWNERERRELVSGSMVLVRTVGLKVTFRTGLAGLEDSGEDGAEGVEEEVDVGRRGEVSVAVAIVVPGSWLWFSDSDSYTRNGLSRPVRCPANHETCSTKNWWILGALGLSGHVPVDDADRGS